jgi:hypothetical protein
MVRIQMENMIDRGISEADAIGVVEGVTTARVTTSRVTKRDRAGYMKAYRQSKSK